MSVEVTLRPSGRKFHVPEGSTVLSAGLLAGAKLPYSCREGICNSCQGRILGGKIHYGPRRPAFLTAEQESRGIALLCQALPLTDVMVEVTELSLERPKPRVIPCRVKRIIKAAPDVAIVRLRLPIMDNFMFVAGQYIEILLEAEQRRSYSIAVPPSPKGVMDLELHIRHIPGGVFTQRLFGDLKEGEILRFEGPLGSFCLREESGKPAILVASGTGFAPMKALVEHALGSPNPRPMHLYWGCRTRRDLYMPELPLDWQRANPWFKYVPVLSEPLASDRWQGRTGLVHRAVMADFPDLSQHQVYACGAPAMVAAARSDLIERCGLPEAEFFADAFLTQADRAAARIKESA